MIQNCVLWAQYSWIMPVCCQGPLLDLLDSRYVGWHRLIDLLYHRHIIVEDSWIPATMRNVGTTPTTTTSNNTSISSLSWLYFRTAKSRKSLNLILCHQFGPCFPDYTCPWTSMTFHVQKGLTAKAGRKASGYGDITGCETPCRSLSKAMASFISKTFIKISNHSSVLQKLEAFQCWYLFLSSPSRGGYLPVAKNHVRYSWAQLGLTWLVQGLVWTKISALQKPLHHWSRLKPRNFLGINRTNHPCEDENGQCWTTTCTHWIQNCDVELWKEIKSWEFGIQVPVFCNAPVQETVIHGGAHSKLPLIYSQYIIDHRNLSVESLKDLLSMCSHKLWIHWIHKNQVSPH